MTCRCEDMLNNGSLLYTLLCSLHINVRPIKYIDGVLATKAKYSMKNEWDCTGSRRELLLDESARKPRFHLKGKTMH
jgi:hypothetical protein